MKTKPGLVGFYREPVCPLCWGFNPPKEGPNSNQNRGSFGFQVYIYIYMLIYGAVSRVAPPPPPPPHGMGPPPLPPYLMHFAHATVAKLTFPYFCMHAAVAKRTFSFCWMNPLAGFGGSIARNCGEMQILSSKNGSAQCTGHFNAQQMESYTYTYPCTYIFITSIVTYVKIYTYIYIFIYVHIHIHIDIFIYT